MRQAGTFSGFPEFFDESLATLIGCVCSTETGFPVRHRVFGRWNFAPDLVSHLGRPEKVEIYFGPIGVRGEIVVLGVCEGGGGRPWYRVERMRNRRNHYLRIAK